MRRPPSKHSGERPLRRDRVELVSLVSWLRVKGVPCQVSGTGRRSVMAEEENKTIARRFNEVWDKGDEATLEEVFAEDVVDHGAIPGQPPGREGHKYQVRLFRSAVPDLHVTAEDIFSEGDKVAYRWTGRGTHEGELMGIAPTGKAVTFRGIDVLRIEEIGRAHV